MFGEGGNVRRSRLQQLGCDLLATMLRGRNQSATATRQGGGVQANIDAVNSSGAEHPLGRGRS